jgi:Tfp pilus assembly protein PilN
MTTTLTPPPPPSPSPSPSPPASPAPVAADVRFVPIRANLMPDEVLVARRSEALRRRVLMALAGTVALLVALYAISWWQTNSSRGDLEDAQHRTSGLQAEQQRYAPLVTAQAQTRDIAAQLRTLLANDLSWRALLNTLRAKAPSGVALTTVTASLFAGTNAGAVPTPLAGAPDGVTPVGQLTIGGTARTKNQVAAYSDALAAANGLAAPLITNVTATGPTLTFSLTVSITSAALGGRFSTPANSTGR